MKPRERERERDQLRHKVYELVWEREKVKFEGVVREIKERERELDRERERESKSEGGRP